MDRDYELQTHQAEDRHWWYRGRRTVIENVIAGMRLPARARILDAGCGSGRNMVELARHGPVTGVELSDTSAYLARAREAGEVISGSVLEMPFASDSFELSVCLDVIEHLDDDLAALRELRRVVAPGGSLLVTVPAYQWLWSGHDEVNHHRRRYTQRSLRAVAEKAGWRQVRSTHFNSLLLPVAVLLRVLDRFSRKTTESSLDLWVPPHARPCAARSCLPQNQASPSATATGCELRNVQARLAVNVLTVTTAVASTCASSLSSRASCANTNSSPSLMPRPVHCTTVQRTGVSASPT